MPARESVSSTLAKCTCAIDGAKNTSSESHCRMAYADAGTDDAQPSRDRTTRAAGTPRLDAKGPVWAVELMGNLTADARLSLRLPISA